MKSTLYHLQLNINFDNLPFYAELMKLLGFQQLFATDDMAAFRTSNGVDLWFIKSDAQAQNYDNLGVNHLSFRVEKQSDVDQVVTFLGGHTLEPLFETPRHRPEFVDKKSETYYQVMFESADKVLFEVVYSGPKS